jgi:putative transcriptional regulator
VRGLDRGDDGVRQNRRVGESLRRRLLVASPLLLDPNFARTVVLMLEHNDDGALGLVLNRPTDTRLGEILPAWGDRTIAPGVVFVGGPVQPDGMIGLVRLPTEVHPSAEPGDDSSVTVLWRGLGTVDLEAPPIAAGPLVRGVRCYVGYSGWGPEQLDGELSQGSWFVVDHVPDDVWTSAPDDLWRTVLRRQPPAVAQFASCPPDPSTN